MIQNLLRHIIDKETVDARLTGYIKEQSYQAEYEDRTLPKRNFAMTIPLFSPIRPFSTLFYVGLSENSEFLSANSVFL